MTSKIFDKEHIEVMSRAIAVAEELVSGYYKLSVSELSSVRYDFRTQKDLSEYEIVNGPLAQVLRYKANPSDLVHSAESYDFYKICIQDHRILEVIESNSELDMFGFFLYIAVHELVHVIRFFKFFQNFDASRAERLSEEKKVHGITVKILSKINSSEIRRISVFFDHWQNILETV